MNNEIRKAAESLIRALNNEIGKLEDVLDKSCPAKKTSIEGLKKWQRRGGYVQYTEPNGLVQRSNNFIFTGAGAYKKVKTSREERMENLRVYQKAGGKVEGRAKRKYNPDSEWRVDIWTFTNRKMKYRKAKEF